MLRASKRTGSAADAAGFTYVGLLIAVVILGLALSAIGTVWRTQARRERETELLFAGHEIRTAIASYYGANANGGHQYPQEIADLLDDRRWPEPHHHLRRLYVDPMTGAADWTLIRIDAIGITGVASSSKEAPIKKAGFAAEDLMFSDATCYCDWQFVYVPRNIRRRSNLALPAAD
ncbi:MAG: hypothetical protein QOD56_534 [Gammaproteobacteria bacterium]|jgi:type II secretory pathway pseudopilin PulG|nr:hypothetical protein [Gammaproteobacteria bacterium]